MAAAVCLAILLNSCIQSLHPIYTKDKLVEIKELPGNWTRKGGSQSDGNFQVSFKGPSGQPESWNFNYLGDKSYLLVHEDNEGLQAAFKVHIIKLGGHYFMDFFPTHIEDGKAPALKNVYKMNSMEVSHLLPVHTFAKLEVTATNLTISLFDPSYLEKLLEHQQIRIKHEKTDGGFVLTASSEELQKFAAKYANDKEAFFGDPIVLQNKL